MNTTYYLDCVWAAVIGILIHVIVVKMPSYATRAKAANKKFSIVEYLNDEWLPILGTMVSTAAILYVWDEWVGFHPMILKYAKSWFIFIGFTGSSLLLSILGRAGKKLNNLIDVKTDIADGVVAQEGAK